MEHLFIKFYNTFRQFWHFEMLEPEETCPRLQAAQTKPEPESRSCDTYPVFYEQTNKQSWEETK